MNQDLFEWEHGILAEAQVKGRASDDENWAAYQKLLKEYDKLIHQSQRLIRVGHTLERQRLLDQERKNAELLRVHQAYARFVPQEILELLLKSDITQIDLGDHIEFEMTVMFADIRNFTTLSERLQPEVIFSLLNDYLRAISPIIKANDGVIDKILGDGILAFFPTAAEDALRAALEVQRAITDFNWQICQPLYGWNLEVGIGLHWGTCILGTLGERDRMNATIISDSVNTSSRIEGLTKRYRCPILLSDEVFQRSLGKEDVVFRFVDLVHLKGKSRPTRVYEPQFLEGLTREKVRFIDHFEQAATLFHQGHSAEAYEHFTRLDQTYPKEASVQVYLDRFTPQGDL